MEKDNRRFTRMPLNIPVKINLRDGTSHKFEQFQDISLGGCQVYSKKEFEMYAECDIEILLGNGFANSSSKVQILGKIMRIGYDFTGIKFIRITQDNLSQLQNLLTSHAPDPEKVQNEFEQHQGMV